jgi:hypothetical protein
VDLDAGGESGGRHHDLFWTATKLAGECKHATDVNTAQQLLDKIEEIDQIFWKTKED